MNSILRLLTIILLIVVVGGACTERESERTFLTTVLTSTPKNIIHEGQSELPSTAITETPQPSLTPVTKSNLETLEVEVPTEIPPAPVVEPNSITPNTISYPEVITDEGELLAGATRDATQTPSIVDLHLTSYCPDQREKTIEELNPRNIIIGQDRLLQRGEISTISAQKSKAIIKLTDDDNLFRLYGTSPNRQRIAFLEWKDGDKSANLKVSNVDGTGNTLVDKTELGRFFVVWLNDENLMLYEDGGGRTPYRPSIIINIFSGERTEVTELPDSPQIYGHTKLGTLYYDGSQWLLQNLETMEKRRVLRWLDNATWLSDRFLFLTIPKIRISPTEVDIIIETDYGFDYVLDLPQSALVEDYEYSEIMSPLDLSGILTDFSQFKVWFADNNQLIFEGQLADTESTSIVSLDFNSLELSTYCIERINASFLRISPDGRYVAWTNYSDESRTAEAISETVILELATGYFARVPLVEFLSWGVETEP